MSFRLRRKSRPQAETNIYGGNLRQKRFDGGMNLDAPASEIKDNELVLAENVICREYGLEARPGSVRYNQSSFSMTPSLVYGSAYSPVTYTGTYANYRHIFAYNNTIRTYPDSPNTTYFEATNATSNGTGTGTYAPGTGNTTICPFRRGSLVFTSSKMTYLEPTVAFQVNTPNPVHGVANNTSAAGNFVYRYLFTFSRILVYSQDIGGGYSVPADRMAAGAEVIHESGTNGARYVTGGVSTARGEDYGYINKATAITTSSGTTIPNGDLTGAFGSTGAPGVDSADGHWTHLSIYRTLDVGPTGIDRGDGQGRGNNRALYVWLADIPRSDIGSNYSDITPDSVLQARIDAKNFLLKTRGFEPMPSGDCAEVTSAFVFVADRSNSTRETNLYYCGLSSPETVGYYHPGFQYQRFDDGIRAMKANQDILSIFCNGSSHICALTSITHDTAKLQYIPVLNYFQPIDRKIGIRDWGTLDSIDQNTMIAVCSDASVRIWDGTQWGPDISYGKVNSEIRQIVAASPYTYARGSVGRYSNGSYILWYSKDSSDTYLTSCIQYGFGKNAGYGWTKNTGFVMPYFKNGANHILDNTGVSRLIVQSAATSGGYSSGQLYWVNTFRPFTGATEQGVQMDRFDKDGFIYGNSNSGAEIAQKWRFRELTSSEESEYILHEETHNYFRPLSEASGYRSGTSVSMVVYKDGSTTAYETLTAVPMTADVHFTKEVAARRVQLEVQVNRGATRYIGIDSHCRTLDRINFATAGDNSSSESTTSYPQYQAQLATNLKHWVTRRDFAVDRGSGSVMTITGSPAWASGPDGGSATAYYFSSASLYMSGATTLYSGDFSIFFWIKSYSNGYILEITGDGGGSNLQVSASNTTLTLSGVTATINSVADSSWHSFVLVRSGSTVSVYQEGALVTTLSTAVTYGGGAFKVSFVADVGNIFDVRVYSDAKSAAAISYYYNDVVNNSGNGVLPQV